MIDVQRSKYGVRTDELGKALRTYRGQVYHSQLEAGHAAHLDMLQKCGEIVSWRRQIHFPLYSQSGQVVGDYCADFLVLLPDGTSYVAEVKGMITDMARWKLKHFSADYDIPVRIIRR